MRFDLRTSRQNASPCVSTTAPGRGNTRIRAYALPEATAGPGIEPWHFQRSRQHRSRNRRQRRCTTSPCTPTSKRRRNDVPHGCHATMQGWGNTHAGVDHSRRRGRSTRLHVRGDSETAATPAAKAGPGRATHVPSWTLDDPEAPHHHSQLATDSGRWYGIFTSKTPRTSSITTNVDYLHMQSYHPSPLPPRTPPPSDPATATVTGVAAQRSQQRPTSTSHYRRQNASLRVSTASPGWGNNHAGVHTPPERHHVPGVEFERLAQHHQPRSPSLANSRETTPTPGLVDHHARAVALPATSNGPGIESPQRLQLDANTNAGLIPPRVQPTPLGTSPVPGDAGNRVCKNVDLMPMIDDDDALNRDPVTSKGLATPLDRLREPLRTINVLGGGLYSSRCSPARPRDAFTLKVKMQPTSAPADGKTSASCRTRSNMLKGRLGGPGKTGPTSFSCAQESSSLPVPFYSVPKIDTRDETTPRTPMMVPTCLNAHLEGQVTLARLHFHTAESSQLSEPMS